MSEDLKNLIRSLGLDRAHQLDIDKLKAFFGARFKSNPCYSTKELENDVLSALGCHLPHDTLALIKQWNSVATPDQRIDPEPLLIPIRQDLNQNVDEFLQAIKTTRYLRNLFGREWEDGIRRAIQAHDGLSSFRTDTHTIIIGFIQEERRGQPFLSTIDNYFEALLKISQKKKSVRDKIGRLSTHLSNYAGGIFELFVLGPLAQNQCIEEYEPPVGTGGNKAEALVSLGSFRCLIEATVSLHSRPLDGAGGFDPKDLAHKMELKLKYKMSQMGEGNSVPILLFYNPHVGVLDEEIKIAVDNFFNSTSGADVLGIVTARDYRMRNLHFYKNPNSRYSLPEEAWKKLAKIFPELS
jgi:hypothetical protein